MSRRESDRNQKLRGMLAAQRAKTDAAKRVARECRKMLANAQTVAQLATDLLKERDAEAETWRKILHDAGENCVKAKAEVERLKADFTAAVVKAQNEGREKQAAAEARVGELEKIIAEGMKWGVNGADAYSATEANKTGEAMRKALRDGGKETK